jgi:hypothetical protein
MKALVTVKEAYAKNLYDQIKILINNGFLLLDTKFDESKAQLSFVAFDPKSKPGDFRKVQLQTVLVSLYSARCIEIEYQPTD